MNQTYDHYVDATDNRFLAPDSMTDELRSSAGENRGRPFRRNEKDLFRTVFLSLAMCYRDSIRQIEKLTRKTVYLREYRGRRKPGYLRSTA